MYILGVKDGTYSEAEPSRSASTSFLCFVFCVVFRRSGPGLHPGWNKMTDIVSISDASPAIPRLPVRQMPRAHESYLYLLLLHGMLKMSGPQLGGGHHRGIGNIWGGHHRGTGRAI